MAGDAEPAAFVGGGDEAKQQLRAGVVEGGEVELVDDDQVVAQLGVDDASDAVVGEAAVEGLDQVGGGAAVVARGSTRTETKTQTGRAAGEGSRRLRAPQST